MRAFVESLLPTPEEDALGALLAAGDEASLRKVLDVEPGHPQAVVQLAELLVARGDEASTSEALALLERIPESAETRRVAALARVGGEVAGDEVTDELDQLLDQVKDDEAARQRFVDLLEVLGPDDPRWDEPLAARPAPPRVQQLREDAEWVHTHVVPWMTRRFRGRSSGDARVAKRPELAPALDLPLVAVPTAE